MDHTETNSEIRKQMLAMREQIPEQKQKEASKAICETLYNLFHANPSYVGSAFLAYRSIRGEADIRDFCEDMMFHAEDFYFPVVNRELLEFYQADTETDFVPGTFGCYEPADRSLPLKQDASCVVFVPGIAFSETGARIGYGKGYYDRFLSTHPNIRKKIGICYESQLTDGIVPQETDVLMDLIVTEERVIRPER